MIDLNQIGKAKNGYQQTVKGQIRAINDRVIIRDMHFGDTTTNGGIIVLSDDGKDRGIKPRWGKVHSKGPENNDPYNVGDWILVEHGRWTRGFSVDVGEEEPVMMRMVEAESVLLWSDEKPEDVLFGDKQDAGDFNKPIAEDFGAR